MRTKIGIVQMHPHLGDKEKNLSKAIEQINNAADQGANIVALPEMFLTGYNLSKIGNKLNNLAEKKDGNSIQKLKNLAQKRNIVIVAPIPEIRDVSGDIYNSAIIIENDGNIIGSYAKTHLWEDEKKYFTPGDSLPIFKTNFGKIGIMTCYDAGFPEVARSLALKGAQIIIMPSAWRIQDITLWDLNTRSRALENSLFLAAINIVGKRNGKPHFFGNSRIVNVDGEIIAEAYLFDEEGLSMDDVVVVEEIDFGRIDEMRDELQYLKDRRPDIYED